MDICIDLPSEELHVDYDDEGINAVCAGWKSIQPTLTVMEVMGGLEIRLACELAALELNVAVINPRPASNCA